MFSLLFLPSDWDLLRKRVLALGWSDGLASWARSATFKKPQKTVENCTRQDNFWETALDVQPTVGQLPVTDVLQVRPGVLAYVLSGGDRTLLQLQFPSVELGTLLG